MANPLQSFVTWLTEPLEQRSSPLDPDAYYPDIDEQLYMRQRALRGSGPTATVKEAMGIPAINRAVTLLSTTGASLQLKEYVNQIELQPASAVIRRPQKEWTPSAFFQYVIASMAKRGESISLVLERDAAGFAYNLLPIPPYMMRSEWNGIRHRWFLTQNGKETEVNARDVVHIPLKRDEETGRGVGPLQECGVALNVAVESDLWASRYFVGAIPSIYLNSRVPLGSGDIDVILERWRANPPNTPKVGHGLDPTVLNTNPESAQLIDTRKYSRGDAALMFGIPGKMLEYTESGSSISYQNVGDLATELVRLTLAPAYLEPIEQTLSDLRPRGTECRFDVAGFERADPKTRFEIHKTAIETGIYDAEYAAQLEGIVGGNPEVIPAPLRRVI